MQMDDSDFDDITRRWNNRYITGTNQVISNVHLPENCEPPCPIHAPSDHHMVSWPTNFRGAWMERICKHGVGHPDPDSRSPHSGATLHHGACDGCCQVDAVDSIV